MPILNREKFYFIADANLLGLDFRTGSSILHLLSNEQFINKHNYWYIEIRSSDAISSIFRVIPSSIIELIKKGEIKLLICNTHEAFHRVVEPIYQFIIDQQDILEENVCLISESADINKEIARVSKIYNKKPIFSIWSRIFENNVGSQLNVQLNHGKNLKTLEPKEYTKKFINFNRRWRIHRPTFVGLLFAKNLLDKGYVSLAKSDDGYTWNTVWSYLLSINEQTGSKELWEILHSNEEKILSLPDMYLDTDELVENKAELRRETDKYYQDTYFSIVSETNFYTSHDNAEPGRFFSEKIFKPIAEKHPFLLISVPNSLSLLRELGYKTFHPYIDESYDYEINDGKRLLMILKETERLCNLNAEELREFLIETQKICRHNFNCLRNKMMYNNEKFYRILPRIQYD